MTPKAVIHATMSLDGFIAGPHDEMDWMSAYVGPNQVADEVIRTTGSVVSGGRPFRLIEKEDQLPYGGATKVPVFIVTHRSEEAVTKLGVESAVKRAKVAAGDRNVMLFGASMARQCLQAGLFDRLGSRHIKLEKIQVVESAG